MIMFDMLETRKCWKVNSEDIVEYIENAALVGLVVLKIPLLPHTQVSHLYL